MLVVVRITYVFVCPFSRYSTDFELLKILKMKC